MRRKKREMEKTRREVERARKRQRKMKRNLVSRRRLEREKKSKWGVRGDGEINSRASSEIYLEALFPSHGTRKRPNSNHNSKTRFRNEKEISNAAGKEPKREER